MESATQVNRDAFQHYVYNPYNKAQIASNLFNKLVVSFEKGSESVTLPCNVNLSDNFSEHRFYNPELKPIPTDPDVQRCSRVFAEYLLNQHFQGIEYDAERGITRMKPASLLIHLIYHFDDSKLVVLGTSRIIQSVVLDFFNELRTSLPYYPPIKTLGDQGIQGLLSSKTICVKKKPDELKIPKCPITDPFKKQTFSVINLLKIFVIAIVAGTILSNIVLGQLTQKQRIVI
jgi:hypothetical protein